MPQATHGCPFCGEHTVYIMPAHAATVPEHAATNDHFQVMCDNCGCCGPLYSTEAAAMNGWERGVPDAEGRRARGER